VFLIARGKNSQSRNTDELPRFRDWRLLVMSSPYELSDFAALLEKYADFRPLGRSRWSTGRERNNTVLEREEVVRERLANHYRKNYRDRTRNYALRESEIFTLKELGKFRVISADDLNRFAYDENRARLDQDLQHLKNQRLISDRQIDVQDGSHSRVLSLTKEAKRFVRHQNLVPKEQALTMVDAIRAEVTKGRAPSWTATISVAGSHFSRPFHTEFWRSAPPSRSCNLS